MRSSTVFLWMFLVVFGGLGAIPAAFLAVPLWLYLDNILYLLLIPAGAIGGIAYGRYR